MYCNNAASTLYSTSQDTPPTDGVQSRLRPGRGGHKAITSWSIWAGGATLALWRWLFDATKPLPREALEELQRQRDEVSEVKTELVDRKSRL